MSGNLENERSNSKIYPIDLVAPQKITIVKNVTNSDVKTSHVVSTQTKSSGTSQLITHGTPLSLMRPSTQIISSNVQTQVSQIVSQSPQIISQGSQLISQSSMMASSNKTLSPGTQIISQGSQLGSHAGGAGGVSQQILNVGGQLVSGSNLVVSSTVRAIPQSVRVLPPMQHITRPGVPTVSISNSMSNMGSGVVVSKTITSHVPRGPAVGASLTVPRVATRPVAAQTLPLSSLGNNTGFTRGVRGAVVYSGRVPRPMTNNNTSLAPVITLPSSLLNTNSVITGTVRATAPRAVTPTLASTPRPLSLQKNYAPTKIVGVSQVGNRPPVGNSAPSQLYYEVTRNTQRPPRPQHLHNTQPVSVVNPVRITPEDRSVQNSVANTAIPRAPVLRKRDVEESPTKPGVGPPVESRSPEALTLWDTSHDNGGSTTESATSSPAPDDEMPSPPIAAHENIANDQSHATTEHPTPVTQPNASPRKKPRKQLLTNDVRKCEYQAEEAPPTPPPSKPPPKRPTLSSSYVCGWRATALHFTRPTDVKRKEPRPRDLVAIASQRHVLATADGWKVHHITNMMDDLVAMESDVGEQLSSLLQSLETTPSKAQTALAPHSHALLELVKGNIQRSKIVSEGIQEAREDILRVFTHRTFVAGILTRQADKRCFRKHRSQS